MIPPSSSFQSVMTGTPEQRVSALQQFLGYPVKERDPQKNQFWYLRPGVDKEAARETRPVAVEFYPELNEDGDSEIKAWVASKESPVSHHFFDWNDVTNQPVMYLLLPEAQQSGRVALVLPSESRQWRQRQVLTYEWDSQALLTPLGRLQQGELELMQKVEDKPMFSVPLVEWAFYKPIATAKELAQELARVSRDMEQIIADYKEATLNQYLKDLFNSFKRELLPNLKVSADNAKDYSFADIYAQTIAYGLFTARMFSHVRNPREDFNRQDAWDKLPETNPFLRQLFQGISEQPVESLGDDLADKISEVFSILRAAKMDAILSDFRQKMNREDIVIRFYEDFLAAYKPEMRERRGVYYTPEPVVSYMVRSVDILLKEKFDKPLGLADPEVMILDPACGTGTFLLWIFQLIHQRFEENPEALTEGLEDKSWSGYVQERLLPRVFGFELLMAPYAIAHLKLGLFLEETGYRFNGGKRLGVYLTNTLDDAKRRSETLFEEFIAQESELATVVKRDSPVMVIVGNPPYSYESANTGEWISKLIQDYYELDGVRLGERNPRGLQDDYVKFIRFGQWKIEKTKNGILAFINNHGYLSNPTFRGIRKSLMNSFDQIFVVDLHGNLKRRSEFENELGDENVFDIQQGVSINILLCSRDVNKGEVRYSDVVGKRELNLVKNRNKETLSQEGGKYKWLKESDLRSSKWDLVYPSPPFYLFIPYSENLIDEYNSGFKISEIFDSYSVGISTSRDKLTVRFTESEMLRTIQEFLSLDPEEAREVFGLGKDVRDWTVVKAQNDLKHYSFEEMPIQKILYRPFDFRYTCFTGNTCGFHSMPRPEIMRYMLTGRNLALCTNRQVNNNFKHSFVSEKITDGNAVSLASRERTYVFPLHLFQAGSGIGQMVLEAKSGVNFSHSFLSRVSALLGFTPEHKTIFNYIYAILSSRVYRERYSEFLKIDFPRIPLTGNQLVFRDLSRYGEALIDLHLMKSPRLLGLTTKFDQISDRTVDPGHPKYTNGKVTINKRGAGFTGVPEEVWNFYIGGYQVCHKWLKDRKGRTLNDEDILHYQKIIVALQETIHIMQQIDEAIPSWPIE